MGWDVCESSTFIVAFYDSVGIDEFLITCFSCVAVGEVLSYRTVEAPSGDKPFGVQMVEIWRSLLLHQPHHLHLLPSVPDNVCSPPPPS